MGLTLTLHVLHVSNRVNATLNSTQVHYYYFCFILLNSVTDGAEYNSVVIHIV